MRRVKATLWSVVFLAVAVPVQAQTPFKFVSGGSVTAFGYYVGPYTGATGPGYTEPILLNCVDFFHHVSIGQTWLANLTSLSGTPDLSNTRFGGMTDALDLYRQAAWLTTMYAANPGATGDIQATIWRLFGGSPIPSPTSDYWLQQAQQNFNTIDFSNFYVITDVNRTDPNSVQEFIAYTATPEPVTLALLGSGLVGLGAAARRRKKRMADEEASRSA